MTQTLVRNVSSAAEFRPSEEFAKRTFWLVRVIVRWTVRSNQVDLIMRWKLIFAVLCTNVGVDLAKNLFALLLVVEIY